MSGPYAALDGGWGWVIVACSIVLHCICLGSWYAMSVLYVSWLEEFDAGKGVTSWIISVAVAFTFGIGPVPAYLSTRFGYKTVVISGSLLSALGLLLSSFANSVYLLVFTMGIVTGTGGGFCYFAAVAMITVYFNKLRSVAMGIGTSGVGIGSFLLAPLFHWLNEEYGWRGTILITSGIFLNMSICAFLIRPLKQESVTIVSVIEENECTNPLLRNGKATEISTSNCEFEKVELHTDSKEDFSEVPLKLSRAQQIQESERMSLTHLKPENVQSRQNAGSLQHLNNKNLLAPQSHRLFSSAAELRTEQAVNKNGSLNFKPIKNGGSRLRISDILMSGSMHSLALLERKPYSRLNDQYNLPVNSNTDVRKETDQSEVRNGITCKLRGICNSIYSFLSLFKLFQEPIFICFGLSNILTNLSYLMPVVYMVDRAIASDIDKTSAALLVSINGAGNLFGRIFFGVLADRAFVDRLVCYIVCLVVCGAATSVSPVCGDSFALHGIYSFIFGCFIGGYVALVPVVTVDLMGEHRVAQALGCIMLCMGIAGVIGPPLAGEVYEWTGSFSIAFILHGIFLVASGVMLVPLVCIRKNQHKQTEFEVTTEDVAHEKVESMS